MKKGSVDSIESFGLVDGPGIRTVVFLSGCKLRCKYCHNPEMWKMGEANYTAEELAKKILKNKPYFRRNNGGVTFSGGEPLLQSEFLIEVCKILKKEGIHIALDTAGVGNGNYEELLSTVDLVLFDIKHVTEEGYQEITGLEMDPSLKFIESLNKSDVSVWIRQVIVPGIMDNDSYLEKLSSVLKTIKNIEKIEFLPYHTMGKEKYKKLGISYPYEDLEEMNKEKCEELYQRFMRNYYGKK
ncbi:MAG: pyruvate formate lyase-activating protein [Bacilli bacterium]|nr:pyruvate formate lyase-activating protein [Bacilli bacterium]